MCSLYQTFVQENEETPSDLEVIKATMSVLPTEIVHQIHQSVTTQTKVAVLQELCQRQLPFRTILTLVTGGDTRGYSGTVILPTHTFTDFMYDFCVETDYPWQSIELIHAGTLCAHFVKDTTSNCWYLQQQLTRTLPLFNLFRWQGMILHFMPPTSQQTVQVSFMSEHMSHSEREYFSQANTHFHLCTHGPQCVAVNSICSGFWTYFEGLASCYVGYFQGGYEGCVYNLRGPLQPLHCNFQKEFKSSRLNPHLGHTIFDLKLTGPLQKASLFVDKCHVCDFEKQTDGSWTPESQNFSTIGGGLTFLPRFPLRIQTYPPTATVHLSYVLADRGQLMNNPLDKEVWLTPFWRGDAAGLQHRCYIAYIASKAQILEFTK